LPYLHLHCLLILFIASNPVRTKSNKSCKFIPSFIELYTLSLKLEMKQGFQGQTKVQREGNLKDNFIVYKIQTQTTHNGMIEM
jgi:antitoxin component YwqK of YwqJK toxin-antitoxin module